ncbi:hypothetical protein [Streptomyces fuscigenes]|uniref:hypothetical protein n=1 Tax=Streptomyces fuscigenes TaxID=1528880 RepID=UPI001F1665B8|nr:hypothetical protein [Streptomyces fuscigenes]MCF3962352.1 hypothetical protein [Streptomyces fuscigenes]
MRGTGRRAGLAAVAALGAVLLSACGVRTTSVPVDAGAAPSRMPCEVQGKDVITRSAPESVPVRIYLVCASELAAVQRAVPLAERPGVARVPFAQALLDELQADPSSQEHEAGFTTYVRSPLLVTGARPDDPAGTLRLSTQPEDLPGTALAQIVCTLVENDAGGGSVLRDGSGRVVLGGPGAYRPHAYGCDRRVKADPDAPVPTAEPSSAGPSPS